MAISFSKGKVDLPKLFIIYSADGLGKSTLAASAPNPVFIDLERGSDELDVQRVQGFEKFDEVVQAVEGIIKDPKDYQTIVVDSLTKLEPMVWSLFEDPGYGRGSEMALTHWRKLTAALDKARAAGFNIILTAHSWPAPANDPTTEIPYDKMGLRLDKKTAAFFREWVYGVFYIAREVLVKKEKGAAKGKVVNGDKDHRIIYTVGRPAFDAKSRYPIGDEIVLPTAEGYDEIFATALDPDKDLANLIPQIQDAEIKEKATESWKSGTIDKHKLLKRVIDQIESEQKT